MTERFVTGDPIRVVINGTLTGITTDGTLTVQYPSDLGACESAVELEGTGVLVLHQCDTDRDPDTLFVRVGRLEGQVRRAQSRVNHWREKAEKALAELDDATAELQQLRALDGGAS